MKAGHFIPDARVECADRLCLDSTSVEVNPFYVGVNLKLPNVSHNINSHLGPQGQLLFQAPTGRGQPP